MHMFQDNRKALEVCSLACKAMFALPRYLIHQVLHVMTENNQWILAHEGKKRYTQEAYRELGLRFLSFMAERDPLQYTRYPRRDSCPYDGAAPTTRTSRSSTLPRRHSCFTPPLATTAWRYSSNSKNSTLRYLRHETWMSSGVSVPPIIARPLRGAFGVLALARGT